MGFGEGGKHQHRSQAPYDDVAYARCVQRDDLVQERIRARTAQLAVQFKPLARILAAWSRMHVAIRGAESSPLVASNGYLFGTLVGTSDHLDALFSPGIDANLRSQVARTLVPFIQNGALIEAGNGCTPGYTGKLAIHPMFDGKRDGQFLDGDAYQCVRDPDGVEEQLFDFGGMYGQFDDWNGNGMRVNPITGAASCPSDFVSIPLRRTEMDRPIYECSKLHEPNTRPKYTLGGAFSYSADWHNYHDRAQSARERRKLLAEFQRGDRLRIARRARHGDRPELRLLLPGEPRGRARVERALVAVLVRPDVERPGRGAGGVPDRLHRITLRRHDGQLPELLELPGHQLDGCRAREGVLPGLPLAVPVVAIQSPRVREALIDHSRIRRRSVCGPPRGPGRLGGVLPYPCWIACA